MNETRIQENQWQAFGERFSRDHRGWLTHIYQLRQSDLEQGDPRLSKLARIFTDDLPLQEVRAAADRDTGEVILTVGEDRAETSYLIEDVVAIFSRTTGDGQGELRIDSRGGSCTLVQLSRGDTGTDRH